VERHVLAGLRRQADIVFGPAKVVVFVDDTDALLTAAGWAVIRVWEHEDAEEAADVIADLVRARRSRH